MQVEYAAPGPGQCVLHNVGGRLFVERADPVIAITPELVSQILRGEGHPDLHYDGRTLIIDGANQHAAYRLGPSGHAGYLLGQLC